MLKRTRDTLSNEWGLDEEGGFHSYTITPSTQVVAIDPGRRNLYDAVGGSMLSLESMKFTNRRWQEMSGTKHGRQKRSHWMSLNKGLMTKLHQGPSPKCYTTASYNEFLKHFLSLRDEILRFFRDPKWRRLRFKTRITRQKAYDV